MSSLDEKRSSSGEFPSETDLRMIARGRVSGFCVCQSVNARASSTFVGPESPGFSLSVSTLIAPMICAAFAGSVTALPASTTCAQSAPQTVPLLPQAVLAGRAVTDPAKAAQIIGAISVDTLKLKPGDSGPTNVELARAFTLWHTQKPDTLPRAIILRSVSEGNSPLELRFSSSEDIAALRPRLRISFTSKVPLGLP